MKLTNKQLDEYYGMETQWGKVVSIRECMMIGKKIYEYVLVAENENGYHLIDSDTMQLIWN